MILNGPKALTGSRSPSLKCTDHTPQHIPIRSNPLSPSFRLTKASLYQSWYSWSALTAGWKFQVQLRLGHCVASSHKKYSLSARLHSRVYQNTEKMSVNQKNWRVTWPCTDILVSTEYHHSQPINASETGLPSSTLTMSHKLQLAF